MTAPLTSDVRARIAKLVPMLSSDKAGEVAGTAAAIGRVLKATGHDWHDLAQHVGHDGKPTIIYRDAFGRTTKPPADVPPLFECLPRSKRLTWLDHAVASDHLDDFERGLAVSVRAKVWSQPHSTITPKQCAVLSGALGKLWLAGVRA